MEFNPRAEQEEVLEDETNRDNGFSGGWITGFGCFPPGYVFKPSDDELVLYYLKPKVNNMELPPNKMHEIDLYDRDDEEKNPFRLTQRYEAQGKGEWYFFTPRFRKYPNGCRPCRSSGGGYWKASGTDEGVEFNGEIIGYKQNLVYYMGEHSQGRKTNWLMTEFKLFHDRTKAPVTRKSVKSPKSDERIKLDEWVLCKIYYHHTKTEDKQENHASPEQAPKRRAKNPNHEPASKSITNQPTTPVIHPSIPDGSNLYNQRHSLPMMNDPSVPDGSNLHNRFDNLPMLNDPSVPDDSNLHNRFHNLPMLNDPSVPDDSNLHNRFHNLPMLNDPSVPDGSNLHNRFHNLPMMNDPSVPDYSNLQNRFHNLPMLNDQTPYRNWGVVQANNNNDLMMSSTFEIDNSISRALANVDNIFDMDFERDFGPGGLYGDSFVDDVFVPDPFPFRVDGHGSSTFTRM